MSFDHAILEKTSAEERMFTFIALGFRILFQVAGLLNMEALPSNKILMNSQERK